MNSLVSWLLPLGFIGLGLAGTLAGLRYLLLARASKNWPFVSGTVLRSNLVEETDEGTVVHRADVLYSYEVAGQKLESSQVFLVDDHYLGKARAERRVARYPVGSEVTVYYDPNHITRGILLRGPSDGVYTGIAVSSLFFLVGVGMAFFFLPAMISGN